MQTVPAACGEKGDEEHPYLPYKNKAWGCAKYIFSRKITNNAKMETGLLSESTDVTQGYDCHN